MKSPLLLKKTSKKNSIVSTQLKELAIDNFISVLNDKMLGKPYRWAQDLCGLEFLNTTSTSMPHYSSVSNELVQLSVPKIVKQIRSRWQSRLVLHSQISALGKLTSLNVQLVGLSNFYIFPTQRIKTSRCRRSTRRQLVSRAACFSGLQSPGKSTVALCQRNGLSTRM